ncbi:unnamed protein product [Allacma fusca]|uniref:Uncharacterized protein n=1 Tax=Allacma fusca TaxID=39272 RepID=A0A8J2P519_9HEXA|nr:unnamed protein product [Allacma fusca]
MRSLLKSKTGKKRLSKIWYELKLDQDPILDWVGPGPSKNLLLDKVSEYIHNFWCNKDESLQLQLLQNSRNRRQLPRELPHSSQTNKLAKNFRQVHGKNGHRAANDQGLQRPKRKMNVWSRECD